MESRPTRRHTKVAAESPQSLAEVRAQPIACHGLDTGKCLQGNPQRTHLAPMETSN